MYIIDILTENVVPYSGFIRLELIDVQKYATHTAMWVDYLRDVGYRFWSAEHEVQTLTQYNVYGIS